MVIVQEPLSKRPVEQCNKKKDVRGVVGVDGVESPAEEYYEGEEEDGQQRVGVLPCVAEDALSFWRGGEAVDPYAVYVLYELTRTELGADDRDLVSRRDQGPCLVSGPRVVWKLVVLDDEQDPALSLQTATLRRLAPYPAPGGAGTSAPYHKPP